MPVTQETLPKILGELDMSDELESNLRIFLSTAPSGPVHRFLAYLSCIHTSLGGELISTDDIVCTSSPKRPRENIQQIYTNKRYDDPETKAAHSTYLHEMHRLELVANGDVEALRKKTTTMLPGEQGWIGSDSLRQAKNIFIAACTLYTRAAISGGLDAEEAYDLSDIYIRTCESYNNPADVERLQRTMPLDFAERVEREVKLSNVSKPIIEAIHYIKEHIDEPIQANDIADHVNLSTSYFLKRFKAETGTGVSEYITKARINEACMLLTYTDKSLTEISNYLYFSSQSYFQNVFKKLMGLTPGQYRNTKQTLGFRKALVP
jgi:AraC-like DNA-binding protein